MDVIAIEEVKIAESTLSSFKVSVNGASKSLETCTEILCEDCASVLRSQSRTETDTVESGCTAALPNPAIPVEQLVPSV